MPAAKLLIFTVDRQIDHAIATAQSQSGCLTIGIHSDLAFGPIVEATGSIEIDSNVQFRFVEASPSELQRLLNERSLDVIFTFAIHHLAGTLCLYEELWSERLYAIVPSSYELASAESAQWKDLSVHRFLLRSHQGDLSTYRAIAACLGGERFDCRLQDVSRGTLIELVRRGFGISVTVESGVLPQEGVSFVPLIGENSFVSVEAIWPKDDRNPLRHHFLEQVRQQASKRPKRFIEL